MPEWIASALANVVAIYDRIRVRVRVTVKGPLGLDQPHGLEYVITVSNRQREPVGVVRAELEIKSREGLSAGNWGLGASPQTQVTIAGRHQGTWTLAATEARTLLVNKGLYKARARGVVTLGTGGTRRSGWQRIDRPRAPGLD